jgi:hypothetical protein
MHESIGSMTFPDVPLYTTVQTLLINADDVNGPQIGRIDGAIWPPKGSAVELYEPNRDAEVVGTRLSLAPTGDAAIFVYLKIPEPEHFMPKDAGA